MSVYSKRKEVTPVDSAFFKLPDTLLLVLDGEMNIRMISQGWHEVFGCKLETLQGAPFHSLLEESDRDEIRQRLIPLINGDATTSRFSARTRHIDGRTFGLVWSVSHDTKSDMFYAAAHETAVNLGTDSGTLPDIFVDALTGLPNRNLFLDRLEHTLRRAERRPDMRFAVLYGGIDRFKLVNHSLGNRMGDLLLSNIANVLQETIRPTDMVARVGGDEFALILDDVRDVSSPIRVVKRIQQKLVLPFRLHHHDVFTTASFGITLNGGEHARADDVLRDANMAMVRAKSQGGGAYVLYDKQMHDAAVRRLEIEADLHQALERKELEAYYQPIVDLRTQRLSGFEALVRWNHPRKGLISPTEFIPIAEETGLIVQIGSWMLHEACQQTRAWNLRHCPRSGLSVSVNLSARQFQHANLLKEIRSALNASGLPPSRLKLEITESAMMEDAEGAIALLNQLKKMKCKLLLDDFGTGYSSLSYLHKLPVDTIKVDRSFVMEIHNNDADRRFVEAIVQLARQLERDVICEGIELSEQEQILRDLKVEYGQGYLYSRPVTAQQAEMLILEDRAARS